MQDHTLPLPLKAYWLCINQPNTMKRSFLFATDATENTGGQQTENTPEQPAQETENTTETEAPATEEVTSDAE